MSIYLEIAIAIILVFFALSLVVTAINEAIAVAVNARGRMLLKALKDLIDDEVLRNAVLEAAPIKSIIQAKSGKGVAKEYSFPERLPPDRVIAALLAASEGSNQISKDSLIGKLIADAKQAKADTTEVLIRAYDDAMGQLSVRYKRSSQIWAAGIGLGVAIIFNINVIALAGAMSTDQVLRDAIVTHAGIVVANGVSPGSQVETGDIDAEKLGGVLVALQQEIDGLEAISRISGLGWERDWLAELKGMSMGVWLVTGLAWLLAALAAVLGAPFWFDLLSRAVRMRAEITAHPMPKA